MSKANERYATDVFINCPFDADYDPLFDAIQFAVTACGFRLRCALEVIDASENRLDKLIRLLRDCRLGIHDISRTEPDAESRLPRFNMPFELGLFLGAKRFGNKSQQNKNCLILDSEKYRYQKFLSDIAGQDIAAHDNAPSKVLTLVRDWLNTQAGSQQLPGPMQLSKQFASFLRDRTDICRELRLDQHSLAFKDRAEVVKAWFEQAEINRSITQADSSLTATAKVGIKAQLSTALDDVSLTGTATVNDPPDDLRK